MKLDCMDKSFEMVFTKSLIMRINQLTSNSGEVARIIIDVHGLTCREAKRFINNVVNITKDTCDVEVIHGYRHGTWNINPVTRTVPNGKGYNRNKIKQEDRRNGRMSGNQDNMPFLLFFSR